MLHYVLIVAETIYNYFGFLIAIGVIALACIAPPPRRGNERSPVIPVNSSTGLPMMNNFIDVSGTPFGVDPNDL